MSGVDAEAELVLLTSGQSVGRLEAPGVQALLRAFGVTNTQGTPPHNTATLHAPADPENATHEAGNAPRVTW